MIDRVEINELKSKKIEIAKSDPTPLVVLPLYVKSSSCSVSCTFCRPHLPKVLGDQQFFTALCNQLLDGDVDDVRNRALALVLCTFCQPHLPRVCLSVSLSMSMSMSTSMSLSMSMSMSMSVCVCMYVGRYVCMYV